MSCVLLSDLLLAGVVQRGEVFESFAGLLLFLLTCNLVADAKEVRYLYLCLHFTDPGFPFAVHRPDCVYMDFLKSAVASAIAKSGSFPYSIGDRLDNNESVWSLHNGTKKVTEQLFRLRFTLI